MAQGSRRSSSPVVRVGSAAVAATAALSLFATGAATTAAAECHNEPIRRAQVSSAFPDGTAVLPDCMALEMISPPRKALNNALAPVFSRSGSRILFRSQAALAETEGLQSALGDGYVATRGESGWSVSPSSPPRGAAVAEGGPPVGGPYGFAPDFDRWDSFAATQAQGTAGVFQVFEGGLDGRFAPLSPLLVPVDNSGTRELSIDAAKAYSPGTSGDLSTTVFRPFLASSSYLEGDPTTNLPEARVLAKGEQNNYVASNSAGSGSSLALLARDRNGVVYGGECGVHLGGGIENRIGTINQGAVSADGSRILFSARTAQPAGQRCGARGKGATEAGSTEITGVWTAEGSGTVTLGSDEVRDLRVPSELEAADVEMSGEFLVGQVIEGDGIAAGTTITAVAADSLRLSVPATSTGANVALVAGAAPFAVGESIAGAGIPPAATIAAVSGRSITLSSPATETASGTIVRALFPTRILERQETELGPVISELLEGQASLPGDDLYQGASLDGSKVYFTTSRSLLSSDHDAVGECAAKPGSSNGCDLYLYDLTRPGPERVIQISAGGEGDPSAGEGADVLGVVAISADGSHAYFVAEGGLTTRPGPAGTIPVPGEPNLYLYERDPKYPNGRLSFVGALSPDDESSLWGVETSFSDAAEAVPTLGESVGRNEAGGDGHVLVFASKAAVTAEGTEGVTNLFRYDADGETLERVSKPAPGGGASPPADVAVASTGHPEPPNTTATQWRWVSEDGKVIGFSSAEPLTPAVGSGAVHAFLWRDGVLTALPEVTEPPSVSVEGDEVAFQTTQALLPQDVDTAGDIYVARVDGGFPTPAQPQPCDPLQESGCQAPGGTPSALVNATATFAGTGNPKLVPCGKGKVNKARRCVKRHHKKRHHGKTHQKKTSSRTHRQGKDRHRRAGGVK
jgi:hypothetical protein